MHFKHLQGQHDQRDHGRRKSGSGAAFGFDADLSQTSDRSTEQQRIRQNLKQQEGAKDGEFTAGATLGEFELVSRPEARSRRQNLLGIIDQSNEQIRSLQDKIQLLTDEGKVNKAERFRDLLDFAQSRQRTLQESLDKINQLLSLNTAQYKERQRIRQAELGMFDQYTILGRTPTDLSIIGSDGLPSMKRVEVGNENIMNISDAIEFLNEGGELSGVPDDFLLNALRSSDRFQKTRAGGDGVNGTPIMFNDTLKDRSYIAKYVDNTYAPYEYISEMLGNNIVGRMGFPVGGVRFAGTGRDTRKPILLEHVRNLYRGRIYKPEDYPEEVAWFPYEDSNAKIPTFDYVNASLMDYILLNPDRHRDNFFLANLGDITKPRFVPIDQGFSFGVSKSSSSDEAPADFFQSGIKYVGMHKVLRRMASKMEKDDPASYAQLRDEITSSIEIAQTRLREVNKRSKYQSLAEDVLLEQGLYTEDDLDNMSKEVEDLIDQFITYPQFRIDRIVQASPERITNYMLDNLN